MCVRQLAGFKNPGSLSVNKTHMDGPPWHQQPMGFCRNSFSPRGCFDLKMLKQLKRERERGDSKWSQQRTHSALNESPSSSCGGHGLRTALGPAQDPSLSTEQLGSSHDKDMQTQCSNDFHFLSHFKTPTPLLPL